MAFALVLLVLAAAWRITAVFAPGLSNFAPLMALTFCGALYFRDKRMWLVPLAALTLSDFYLDHYYATVMHYEWPLGAALIRALCFVAALGIGAIVARHKSWRNVATGTLASSALFYLVTNTASWAGDTGYAHNFLGWWQAMTIGHPEFPSTLSFFRNTLVSDVLFTGMFVGVMEYAALRAGRPSLISRPAAA
jgi:hypothetical protein